MDLQGIKIKKEQDTLETEDTNENYLKYDFEICAKFERDSPVIEDWCLQNAKYQHSIECTTVKEESDVNTCFICFKMFADSHSLYKHNIMHMAVVLHPPSLYQCNYCLCYCTSKVKIREHIQIKHFLKLKKQCKSVFPQDHQCIICKKSFSYKKWCTHMTDVHGTEKLRCIDCNVTFKCKRYLQRHLLYVHEHIKPTWRINTVRKIKCEKCPGAFYNKSAYKVHLTNCHSSEMHECTLCHSKLKCKSYLLTHMKRVHYNDGKSHKCNICYKVFRSPRYLKIHKKNSHDVKVKAKMLYNRQRKRLESSDSSVSL